MISESNILISSAAILGIVHTILGPDHYIPFIAIAKARNWKHTKTALITILCGIGHILSSVITGLLGIIFGWALFSIRAFEVIRGEIAGSLLLVFGICYTLWALFILYRKKPHKHPHYHTEGIFHRHRHSKSHAHSHSEERTEENIKKNITPWTLFIIFVFGPCEPLIPVIMYPAASQNFYLVIIVSLIFALTTILTMLAMTFAGIFGLSFLSLNRIEKYIHIIAGITIIICGITVRFLGL